MLLIVHVGIALSSVVYTAWSFFRPSQIKLNICYVLVALTIGTGTALVFQYPASLPAACATGLLYLQVVAVGLIFVHRKVRQVAAQVTH